MCGDLMARAGCSAKVKIESSLIKKLIEKGVAQQGVQDAAEYVLQEANKMVPHDEGDLERSGDISVEKGQASIFYDTPYAKRLHEHPDYTFNKGRQGKWLEKASRESTDKVNKFLVKAVRNSLGG